MLASSSWALVRIDCGSVVFRTTYRSACLQEKISIASGLWMMTLPLLLESFVNLPLSVISYYPVIDEATQLEPLGSELRHVERFGPTM